MRFAGETLRFKQINCFQSNEQYWNIDFKPLLLLLLDKMRSESYFGWINKGIFSLSLSKIDLDGTKTKSYIYLSAFVQPLNTVKK